MRILMALALAIALPAVCLAADWEGLAKLRPGERIWVSYSQEKAVHSAKGRFSAWTTDSFAMEVGKRQIVLARNDVRAVRVYAGKSRAAGAGVGSLVGGAAGAAIYGAAAGLSGAGNGSIVPVGVIVGAGTAAFAIVGAVIGLAVGKTKTEVLYRQ